MRCTSCAHENPVGSLFCQQCGRRAGEVAASDRDESVTCSRCGAQNQRSMRFCTQCGASFVELGTSIGGDEVAPSYAPAFSRERYDLPASGSPIADAVTGAHATSGPLCLRCRSVGEPGSHMCRYCGARYADAGAPPTTSASQPATSASQPVPSIGASARLVAILKDGSDGRSFALDRECIDIGRREGDIILGDDPYVSDRHARLRWEGDSFVVRDLDSLNGVYLRIREPAELRDGDRILIGQQVLRFEFLHDPELPLGPSAERGVLIFGTPETPRVARLVQYTTEGVGRDVHYLYRGETILGRESGDIVFTDDPFLSRRHASITIERPSRRFVLTDMGSSNGTALRIRGERPLAAGDQLRVGRHLFRLEVGATSGTGQGAG